MESQRVTFDGGEKEGNQSAVLLSKQPFVTGTYIKIITYIRLCHSLLKYLLNYLKD